MLLLALLCLRLFYEGSIQIFFPSIHVTVRYWKKLQNQIATPWQVLLKVVAARLEPANIQSPGSGADRETNTNTSHLNFKIADAVKKNSGEAKKKNSAILKVHRKKGKKSFSDIELERVKTKI